MKVLTKSRFKLGLECPNKLYYTDKKEYSNSKSADPFLEALAHGGFQVEALSKLHYPDGILVEGNGGDYQGLWEQTRQLLKQENVVIFEAAFLIDGLFVRTDILVKKGDKIELIEVKAKSFDPLKEDIFVGKRGGLNKDWKPYLMDIAFQKNVMQLCYPNWNIKSFIMMADKSKKASINGLNELFRVVKEDGKKPKTICKVSSLSEIGNSVLGRKNVTHIVADIEANSEKTNKGMHFQDSIKQFKEIYQKGDYPNHSTSYKPCRDCEFKEEGDGFKSGFKECFKKQHFWSEKEFNKPNIFNIWNFRKGTRIFEDGIVFKEDLNEEIIGLKEDPFRLTDSHRQWMQVQKELTNDDSIYVDKSGLKEEMDSWDFPLHFIDFETSTMAIPFNEGLKPYEQIAFQFSHHIYHEDGKIEHATEYINNVVGEFPNFKFLRALKKALENDNGTIFKYSTHENTILNAIFYQLIESEEPDKEELIGFLQDISQSKGKGAVKWKGNRNMVDLCDVEKRYYYNPFTNGSNSLKFVLPASLNSSKFLQEKYSKPLGQINVTSKNFDNDHIWLEIDDQGVKNPYKMLPPVFSEWSAEEMDAMVISDIEELNNGGAALTAYGKMQYTDMSQNEIDALTKSLLKYCELDTLAMVMVFEHFKELIES